MSYSLSPACHRAIVRRLVGLVASSLVVSACHSGQPETGIAGDSASDVLLPGSSLLVPPHLGDSTVHLVVSRRGSADTAPQRMAEVRREQRAVTGEPGQVLLTSTWSPPNISVDSLVIERHGLAPVREHLDYRGTYQYRYSHNHVFGTVQRQDSAERTFDQTFPRNVFAFGELDLLARSLPFRRDLRVVVPLFSESDADLEMDTLSVLGPDSADASGKGWVVRFADAVIVERYVLDTASREILSNEVTQKRSGTQLRFVTSASQSSASDAVGFGQRGLASRDAGAVPHPSPAAPWIVWPPASERCEASTGDGGALLAHARSVLKIDSAAASGLRRLTSRLVVFHDYESDRPYRPFMTLVTDETSAMDPTTGVARDSASLAFGGFGDQPPNVTVSISTPHAVFLRRDTTWTQFDPLWRAKESERQLDPWLVVLDWSATPNARLIGRCQYRDYARLVLERDGTYGPERLYLDPKTGFPVKVDRDEPQYLWGSLHVEYVYSTWLRFGGALMPAAAARLVDGDEETVKEVSSARIVSRDSLRPIEVVDLRARSTVGTAGFLRPSPIDTVRLGPRVFALENPGYNELIALSRDTVVVLDATQSEERARADSVWIGRLFPGRHPIVVVATDLAWPHVAGVRFWVASGATIVSRDMSETFLRAVVARHWRQSPDKLEGGRRGIVWRFRPVRDSLKIAGLALYPIDGIASEGALMAYLPAERLLWASDYVQDTTAPTLYVSEVVSAACRVGITPERGVAEHTPPFAWSTAAELARRDGAGCGKAGGRARNAAAQTAAAPDPAPPTRLASEPTVVGPGVISTPAEEFKATESPDGQTLLYVVADHQFRHMTIVQSSRQGEDWQTPIVAGFSGVWRDGDPAFAPDGRTVMFISNRPWPGDPPNTPRKNFNIWRVERHADGSWGVPTVLSSVINTDTTVFAPSLTTTGVLYFNRGDVIYRAEPKGGGGDYAAPQPLPFHGSDPGIASDERFIVFDDNPGQQPTSDLFVSCRTSSGWTRPSRFLEPVNSKFNEGDPWVTADGRWLYFYSDRWLPAPDRAPRPEPVTYAQVEREAVSNIYNGSRNLYRVDLSSFSCPEP